MSDLWNVLTIINSREITDAVTYWIKSQTNDETSTTYQREFKQFLLFMLKNGKNIRAVQDFDFRMLELYKSYLVQRHKVLKNGKTLIPITVKNKFTPVSSFFISACRQGIITQNPAEHIKIPRMSALERREVFTEAEVNLILDHFESKVKNASDRRFEKMRASLNYTLAFCAFSVGMRTSELLSLTIQDFQNGDSPTLLIYKKGGGFISPIINDSTAQVLTNWIEKYRPKAKKRDLIFVSPGKNTQIYKGKLYHIITDASQELGIDKNVGAHTCRATLASLLHLKGVPAVQIQALLGHDDLSTTFKYIRQIDEMMNPPTRKIDWSSRNNV